MTVASILESYRGGLASSFVSVVSHLNSIHNLAACDHGKGANSFVVLAAMLSVCTGA